MAPNSGKCEHHRIRLGMSPPCIAIRDISTDRTVYRYNQYCILQIDLKFDTTAISINLSLCYTML